MASDSPHRRSIEVSHKNLEKLYFRAYPLNLKRLIERAKDYYIFPQYDELEKMLRGKSPSYEWEVALPQ